MSEDEIYIPPEHNDNDPGTISIKDLDKELTSHVKKDAKPKKETPPKREDLTGNDDGFFKELFSDVAKGRDTSPENLPEVIIEEPPTPAEPNLESRIIKHDLEMNALGYTSNGHYYNNTDLRIAFIKEGTEARAHFFLGYDLNDLVPEGKTIKDVQVTTEKVTTTLDIYLARLAKKYLSHNERKLVYFAVDMEKSRVAFEYSVAYNPKEKEESELLGRLGEMGETAENLQETMAAKIKQRTKTDKEIIYLTNEEIKETYRAAREYAKRIKEQQSIPQNPPLQHTYEQPAQTTIPSSNQETPGILTKLTTRLGNWARNHS